MSNSLNTILLALVLVGTGVNTYLIVSDVELDEQTDEHNHADHATSPSTSTPSVNPLADQAAAVQQPTGPQTSISFDKATHDFGTINQDTKNTHVFKFTNTGSEPLIIQNAQGSCGCTVPQYPKEPIAPGATGEITVEYNPGKQQGMQNKTVTITANTNPPQTLINIAANVMATE